MDQINRPVAIVALSKYIDICIPFLKSLQKYQKNFPVFCVVDGSSPDPFEKWAGSFEPEVYLVKGPEKFSMAGNGNLGLKAVPKDHDILYCGDDVRFIQENTIETLQKVAYEYPVVGILSPKIIGRGSMLQNNPGYELCQVPPIQMWFPCIYLKREVLDKIGFLDERFNDFGSDDLDYCLRVKQAGYELAVTSLVSVQHEGSPEGGPTTFVKNIGAAGWREQEQKAYEKLADKYQVSLATLNQVVQSGQVSLLARPSSSLPLDRPPTAEESAAYLKGRSIYIATPAYGGMLAVNYVNSLIQLVSACKNYGINIEFSFLYNESLITRARNTMVHDYLKKSNCTDFFFIDADIGFAPNDIISLLFHPEEIVAAACPRKNLRLDRVAEAGKSGKQYSTEDLRKICGEFVLNFLPDKIPESINLGQMIEVLDAGTGLMRIQRSVFEKFRNSYPDRYYLPLGDEGDIAEPMYMYFQSEIDNASKEFTGMKYAQYIPEDYAFCRYARRAGMQVFIAPWINTSHAGTYIFEGDLAAVAKAGGKLRK